MMELNELRLALNWNGVYQGKDCLVIHFDESQARSINGLRSNDNCYYLAFPEYREHLVSFLVTRGEECFQYWVLGDRLHRSNGPAKIAINGTTSTSEVTWYQNGLRHNLAGPASTIIRGQKISNIDPNSGEPFASDYLIEQWDEMECYWFINGESALYPWPFAIAAKNGWRIYRDTGIEPIMDDYRDLPAFFAENLVANWNREDDARVPDQFRLRFLVADEYQRSFDAGVAGRQAAGAITQLHWIVGGEPLQTSSKKCETIRTDMFPEWNIWEGPLFPNAQEEIFAAGTVNS